jgi:hypothetical protein
MADNAVTFPAVLLDAPEGPDLAMLEARLRRAWGRHCETHRELLVALADFEAAGGPQTDGIRSMAGWLVLAWGMDYSTAKHLSLEAGVIAEPDTAAGLSNGTFTPDHVLVLAEHGVSPEAIRLAGEMSAPDLRRVLARSRTRPEDGDPAEALTRRRLKLRADSDGAGSKVSGWLPAADAEVVRVCLERLAHQAPPDPITGLFDRVDQRLADALVSVCSARLGADVDHDRATVSVHVDVDVHGDLIRGHLPDGTGLPRSVLERLLCDCRVEFVIHDDTGIGPRITDTARTATPAQRRDLLRRQGGRCGWPGCDATWLLHAHHIVYWTKGGPTSLENMTAICPYHHRLIHDCKWRLSGDPTNPTIHRPDGRRWVPPWAPLTDYSP